ncbi:caspase-1-like isoform X2 [Portunus trituberculatus]|uniref:caspase-1-like isoform X2 n=1 Tax=Portunus trituberculatus TaxID=210409 RepID=UPI001E1CBD76|nr:caspase-1-like isoform X2 [Portunus trituberculatus]
MESENRRRAKPLNSHLSPPVKFPRPIVAPSTLSPPPKAPGDHPLHVAASRGDVREVDELLRKGTNPDVGNQQGFRPLHLAAERGFVEVVKSLKHGGASVIAPTNAGLLAVHLAARNGHVKLLEYLQNQRCNLASEDHSGATPLHYAAQYGNLMAVKWLIKKRVPLQSKDNEGKSPADRAKENRHFEVDKILDEAISKTKVKIPRVVPVTPPSSRQERSSSTETEPGETIKDIDMNTESHKIGEDTTEIPLGGFSEKTAFMNLQMQPAVQSCLNGRSVYPCHTNPRGRVLILNIKSFKDDHYPTRYGAECDTVNLESVYLQMGYEVVTRYDLSRADTLEFFNEESKDSKLSYVSSLFVFIMSHGIGPRTFVTHDAETVTLDEIMNFFLNSRCLSLNGKPKIFFSHFCRGEDEEIRPKLYPEAKREAYRDMLCIFSSTSGFLAYRHPIFGTPSVRAFCQALAEYAHYKMFSEVIGEFQKLFEKMEGATSPEVLNLSFSKHFFLNPLGRKHIPSR